MPPHQDPETGLAVGYIFAVGLGILRANILITASAMLAGKFLRYVIWGWVTGLVF